MDEVQQKRDEQEEQQQRRNDSELIEGEEEDDEDDEDGEGEGEEEEQGQLSDLQWQLTESQLVGGGSSGTGGKAEARENNKLETLEMAPSSSAGELSKNDQRTGDDLTASQSQEQCSMSHQEVSVRATALGAEARTQTQLQSSVCPPSLSELSPTSVTQSISSAPSPTFPEQKHLPSKVNNCSMPEANQQKSSNFKSLAIVPVVNMKTPVSDGYNWRKYGQKQVKSPKGSRSYYKCTHSDCSAKKIECSDHTGHVIEIVNKGLHSHDPPWRNNSSRDSRSTASVGSVLGNSVTEHPIKMLNDSDLSTSSKQPTQETSAIPERKRHNSASSDGNGEIQAKEEHGSEPEPKRRVKKGNLASTGYISKPGKKPKFVVHAAGDVGISGDGYRWRKYGQKMVKGNSHPRNYYRCTSAGCPVRKHIETAVDNNSAVIITYKGVHDHDMPVPKKRHGPPSAPLVAAAAPASMNNLQLKKSDSNQNQKTQWSVGTEGELTGEATDLGGEKAIESARTLLSIGFEIKPC